MGDRQSPPSKAIDVTTPNVARIYDFYLGGKDNYAPDRAVAEKVLAVAPFTPHLARQNRAFLGRAVRFMAESGITQFLDIGTGLPTQGNVHEVADPGSKVAYVDADPIVVAHGRALIGNTADTIVTQHDLRRPEEILDDPRVTSFLDLDQPVGLLLISVLHCLKDADQPGRAVSVLREALAPGSLVAISHVAAVDDHVVKQTADLYRGTDTGITHRSRAQILAFFDGFRLLEPGLVPLHAWRPEPTPQPGSDIAARYYLCGVAELPTR